MTHQIKNILVNDSQMEVFVFEPEGEGPFPVLVYNSSFIVAEEWSAQGIKSFTPSTV